jgi:hypothetical protein
MGCGENAETGVSIDGFPSMFVDVITEHLAKAHE